MEEPSWQARFYRNDPESGYSYISRLKLRTSIIIARATMVKLPIHAGQEV